MVNLVRRYSVHHFGRVAILAGASAPHNPRNKEEEEKSMEKFFHLKENGTTVSTEITAGLTTFFAMSYIIVVNPQILHQTGMPLSLIHI